MPSLLPPHLKRFLRYILVGGGTFAFDLLILWVVIEVFGVAYYIATPLCFLIAVSGNYVLSRMHVFRGTTRRFDTGYGYFIFIAIGGALITTGGVGLLVSVFLLPPLVARILVACIVGMLNYLVNLHFNFRVVGFHP